jgi:hypothetical protein
MMTRPAARARRHRLQAACRAHRPRRARRAIHQLRTSHSALATMADTAVQRTSSNATTLGMAHQRSKQRAAVWRYGSPEAAAFSAAMHFSVVVGSLPLLASEYQ